MHTLTNSSPSSEGAVQDRICVASREGTVSWPHLVHNLSAVGNIGRREMTTNNQQLQIIEEMTINS
jgi:hypothetical protein